MTAGPPNTAVNAAAPPGGCRPARERHRRDRQRHGNAGGERRFVDEMRYDHSDQRRYRVAADDRPRLRQRACRHREQKHGRRAHRRHQQRHMRAVAQHQAANGAGQRNADRRADTGDDALAERRAGKNGNKEAEGHGKLWNGSGWGYCSKLPAMGAGCRVGKSNQSGNTRIREITLRVAIAWPSLRHPASRDSRPAIPFSTGFIRAGSVQVAAATAARPRDRSAFRSSTSSSPICRRISGPS